MYFECFIISAEKEKLLINAKAFSSNICKSLNLSLKRKEVEMKRISCLGSSEKTIGIREKGRKNSIFFKVCL
jgi:hypothetical protein